MAERLFGRPYIFPTELWEYIFGDIPFDEVQRIRQVCRFFSEIVTSLLGRYQKWLKLNGLVNIRGSPMSLNVRMKKLRWYYRAWERLSFHPSLVNGVYFPISTHVPQRLGLLSPNQINHLPLMMANGWLCVSDLTGGLLFSRLPTLSSSTDPRLHKGWFFAGQLTASQLPRQFVTYRFDPSQDLLIIVEPSYGRRHPDIHVRSISTGLPHPLAKFDKLQPSIDPFFEINSFRIHGELCAILACVRAHDPDERTLHVWNWKTGILLLEEWVVGGPWGDTVAFIGDRTLLFVQEGCMQIRAFHETEDVVGKCSLDLPRFHENALQIWTSVSQPYAANAEPGRAFACDPASEFVVINMTRQEPETDNKWSVILAIRLSSLLPLVATHLHEEWIQNVEWEDWAPGCTRLMLFPETWETPSTFGKRCLIPFKRNDSVPVLALIDFDVDTEHVGPQKHDTYPGWYRYVLPGGARVDVSKWFEEPVHIHSQVPCRIRQRGIPKVFGQLVGASLWETGIVLKLKDQRQYDYVSMPLVA